MTTPPELDQLVGMEVYGSPTPGCGGRIKSRAEDFRVEESIGDLRVAVDRGPGMLPLYRVEKRMIDTLHLERELARALKSRVSFAGLKDKRAVAVQYATPTSTRSESPGLIERESFRAELMGYVEKPLSRSMVEGNRFRVVLRGCSPLAEESIGEVYGLAREKRLPNFYGLQRFGGRGGLTHRVGRAVVRGRPDDAIRIILIEPRGSDDEATREAREAMSLGRYEHGLRLLSPRHDVERKIAGHLAAKPGDFVGALREVPIRLRKLYTQAYQSYIFNRTLSVASRRGLDISSSEDGDNWGEVSPDGMVLGKVHGVRETQTAGAVPLVQLAGYAYRNYGSRFDLCVGEVMAEEGVSAKEFFVKEMQEVSVEGGFRRPHLPLKDESFERREDAFVLAFTLARGGYATVLLREMVKPADPVSQGFG